MKVLKRLPLCINPSRHAASPPLADAVAAFRRMQRTEREPRLPPLCESGEDCLEPSKGIFSLVLSAIRNGRLLGFLLPFGGIPRGVFYRRYLKTKHHRLAQKHIVPKTKQ